MQTPVALLLVKCQSQGDGKQEKIRRLCKIRLFCNDTNQRFFSGSITQSYSLKDPIFIVARRRRRQTIDDRRQTIDDRRQTIDDRRQTIDDRRQTIDDRRQTIDDRRQTIDDRRQTIEIFDFPYLDQRGPNASLFVFSQ